MGAGLVVAGMHVAPVRVGLPDLDAHARDRLALGVEHAAHEMDDLPVRAARLAGDDRQIGAAVERLGQGIERPQDLVGRPPPGLLL